MARHFDPPKILCAWETYPGVLADMEPLLHRHQADVGGEAFEPYDPDWRRYAELNASGSLKVWAARNFDREMVGYVVWLILRGLHNQSTRFATADLIYLMPEWRDGLLGYRFLKEAIAAVTAAYRPAIVRVETADTYENGRLGLLLMRMNFRKTGSVYQRDAHV